MKCGNFVIWKDVRRKGDGAPIKKSKVLGPSMSPYITLSELTEAELSCVEICDGNILAHVKAIDEPMWGGSFATLSIEYTCDKCSDNLITEILGLPNSSEDLSRVLTELVRDM